MCTGQHGECLGIETCFAGVHEICSWFKLMATGVFGCVRGQGLYGYIYAEWALLRADEFMNTIILEARHVDIP